MLGCMAGIAFAADTPPVATDPHAAVFAESNFPSASACASCHQKVFSEWSASNHAYASISPMFHKFEQAVNDLTSGTIGH